MATARRAVYRVRCPEHERRTCSVRPAIGDFARAAPYRAEPACVKGVVTARAFVASPRGSDGLGGWGGLVVPEDSYDQAEEFMREIAYDDNLRAELEERYAGDLANIGNQIYASYSFRIVPDDMKYAMENWAAGHGAPPGTDFDVKRRRPRKKARSKASGTKVVKRKKTPPKQSAGKSTSTRRRKTAESGTRKKRGTRR